MKKTILAISTICLMGITSAVASTPNAPIEQVQKTPTQVLEESFKFMGSLPKFKFTATSENLLYDEHKTLRGKYINTFTALVQRPNKLKVSVKGDTKYREYYINGNTFTLYNKERVAYSGRFTLPYNDINRNIDYALATVNEKQPVFFLLYSDLADRVKPNTIRYFGLKKKNGVLCQEIGFKSKDGKRDVYVWIKATGNPLVVAYTLVRKTAVNEYRININVKWDLSPWLSDSDFVFKSRGTKTIPIQLRKTRQF